MAKWPKGQINKWHMCNVSPFPTCTFADWPNGTEERMTDWPVGPMAPSLKGRVAQMPIGQRPIECMAQWLKGPLGPWPNGPMAHWPNGPKANLQEGQITIWIK